MDHTYLTDAARKMIPPEIQIPFDRIRLSLLPDASLKVELQALQDSVEEGADKELVTMWAMIFSNLLVADQILIDGIRGDIPVKLTLPVIPSANSRFRFAG